ncbi:MAG TPA: 4Fe-4S binding protein [Candidatus Paraprevotella stercorigallinarum]|nr:4Fe-4S binding protein [Candidatus Paraprevotella stercorigallinarum]
MLRKIRITLAVVFLFLITLLFLDFTGSLHAWLGWMAEVQFLPAVLALNVGVVIFLLILTLIFGRVYCSVICPMGVMQDVVTWLGGRSKKRRYRFSYSPQKRILRFVVLAVFLVTLVAGINSVVALLAPYSAYGRIAQNILSPVYAYGNNLLAYFAERADSYAFYRTDVWIRSIPTFVVAVLTFVIVAVMAWRNGRTYCNTVCPVGTVLGLVARWSWLKPVIDTEKCNACSLCSRTCKASCIDFKNHQIDYSRCVACMDCIQTCKHGAISYRHPSRKTSSVSPDDVKVDTSRRSFLATTALVAATAALKAQEMKVDGGLAAIEDKKIPNRQTPILPPGTQNARHFAQHCTACQLCVSACPNGVLRPSADLMKFMQPEMSYERGYCRPECNKCSEVCPTDAIKLTDLAEKSATQIGHAVWVKSNCVPLTDGVECGNCARHCPTGAITMIPSDASNADSLKIPAVDVERCIGCGACENLCPSRPFSAIYVEGHERHRIV